MGPIPPEELETWSDEKIAARLNELEAESGEGRVGVPRPLGRDRADGTPFSGPPGLSIGPLLSPGLQVAELFGCSEIGAHVLMQHRRNPRVHTARTRRGFGQTPVLHTPGSAISGQTRPLDQVIATPWARSTRGRELRRGVAHLTVNRNQEPTGSRRGLPLGLFPSLGVGGS